MSAEDADLKITLGRLLEASDRADKDRQLIVDSLRDLHTAVQPIPTLVEEVKELRRVGDDYKRFKAKVTGLATLAAGVLTIAASFAGNIVDYFRGH